MTGLGNQTNELWITNNENYEQFTFSPNVTTYDFDFIDVVGQRISFWVQSPTGDRTGSNINVQEKTVELIVGSLFFGTFTFSHVYV